MPIVKNNYCMLVIIMLSYIHCRWLVGLVYFPGIGCIVVAAVLRASESCCAAGAGVDERSFGKLNNAESKHRIN